jgi:hypothetical protein
VKAEQRKPWLRVVNADLRTSRRAVRHHVLVGYQVMCSFCRFAYWDRDPDSTYTELTCEHPIVGDDRFDAHREGVQVYGEDCWGFRPGQDPPTALHDHRGPDRLWVLRSAPLRFDWAHGVIDRSGNIRHFVRCSKCRDRSGARASPDRPVGWGPAGRRSAVPYDHTRSGLYNLHEEHPPMGML